MKSNSGYKFIRYILFKKNLMNLKNLVELYFSQRTITEVEEHLDHVFIIKDGDCFW